MKTLLLSLAFLSSFNGIAQTTTLTLQPDSSTGNYDYITDEYPTLAQPTVSEFDAVAWTDNGLSYKIRGLVNFDLSSIPSGAVIQSATIYLYFNPNSVNGSGQSQLSGSNAAVLQRITSSWNKNTTNWNNQPTTTTVNQANIPASTSTTQDYIVDVTSLVQDMVDSSSSSFGFMFKLQTEQYYRSLVFASCNHSNSALHPKLVISYLSNVGIQQFGNTISDFKIYPNPASFQLSIQSPFINSNETFTVSIFNPKGELMRVENLIWSDNIIVNIKNLSSGIYFLQVNSKNGSVTKRFVKE